MKITCPKCQKDNAIIVPGGTKCKHCDKSLDEHTFTAPLMPALLLVALALGIGGTSIVQHYTDENRYPVNLEYAIIDQCISTDSTPIRIDVLRRKRDFCIRALEKTQEKFSYSDFKDDQIKVVLEFSKHALPNSFK